MNKLVKYIAVIFAIIIVILLGILIFVKSPRAPLSGSVPEAPSYPTSPDGHVEIADPVPGQTMISPKAVSGWVTGGEWFFEGTFPVKVVDADGTVLGQGQAQAQGDWMSTGTVAFTGTISFSAPHFETGTIVFSKDNPSGLPQNDESFSVPVRFQ
jgi:hypothetical protein